LTRAIPWLAAAASAGLQLAAFPPAQLPEAAWVCLLPLLLWAWTGPAPRHAFAVGYAAGLLTWAGLLHWLPAFTGHLTFIGATALGWLAMLALAAVLALFPASWLAAAAWALPRATGRPLLVRCTVLLGLAGLWCLLEWLRGWICTGFPWLPLAASQWQRPLVLQLATLTGASGVSFLLVTVNLGIAAYLRALPHWRGKVWWQRLCPEFYLAFALLAGAAIYGVLVLRSFQPVQPLLRAGFVQPYIAAPDKWDPEKTEQALGQLSRMSRFGAMLGPDLLLWPEATTPFAVKGHAGMRAWIDGLSAELQLPLLMGNIAVEKDPESGAARWYNGIFLTDPQRGTDVDRYYAKRHLVPFGEYVPLSRLLPFIDKVVPLEGQFYPGASPTPLDFAGPHGRVRIGPLVCYEDIFPALARASVRAGADLLFVATNNAWFGEAGGAWQHAAHSVLRAVETRRPVLRCGNGGWSGWIDAFGHIRHSVHDARGSIYFAGADAADISQSSRWRHRQTFYVRHGDWWLLVCALLVGLATGAVWRLALPRHPCRGAARRGGEES
jgi:apolipoprotein N-acyltransferase